MRSRIIHCILETAVLVTKNEVSHLSSVASLLAMFQIKGSSITVDGSFTLAQVTVIHPFVNTGADYVGPFEVNSCNTGWKTTTNCYVALFICMATKAVELELVSNLASEAFIAALKHFTDIRVFMDHLHSNNGSNFVGANRELKAFFKFEEILRHVHVYATDTISVAFYSLDFTPFWRVVGGRCKIFEVSLEENCQ
jgi:hypothetical protein